ncbi:MAG: CDP-glycerol glycerophosphotransferase family protein [Desulfobacteraceae bacterium]|nr:CDP-glycerol glycerophosphotransferase family protein [Desulfobacteraceae bacterium]
MNYLGHFGPLIDYFQYNGVHIILLCDHQQSKKTSKAYLFPDIKRVQTIFSKCNIKAFHSTEEFAELLIENKIQAVFFIGIDKITREVKQILGNNKYSIVFAQVQSGIDLMPCKNLSSSDVIYIYCENWKKWWKQWLVHFGLITPNEQDDVFEQIENKTFISGFPPADHISYFDREAIYEKYGIPKDKKVVLLLPFPWSIPFDTWSHIIYKHQNKALKLARIFIHRKLLYIPQVFNSADDLKVAKSIRQFADKNNAVFIIKGRLKNKIPNYLQKLADKVFWDKSYYPYTIMELMYIADLCINFYSDGIKESVFCNTPCICLGPKKEQWGVYRKRFSLNDFSLKPYSNYNYEGVVYNESVDDFAAEFPNKTFDDYPLDEKNRDSFIKKFLGFTDLRSSERIYNDISQRIASWENDS